MTVKMDTTNSFSLKYYKYSLQSFIYLGIFLLISRISNESILIDTKSKNVLVTYTGSKSFEIILMNLNNTLISKFLSKIITECH